MRARNVSGLDFSSTAPCDREPRQMIREERFNEFTLNLSISRSGPSPNDITVKSNPRRASSAQASDEMLNPLNSNESANTNNARHVSHRGQSWRWKTFDIDSVVTPVNLERNPDSAGKEKLAGCNRSRPRRTRRSADLRRRSSLPRSFMKSDMCRDAERNAEISFRKLRYATARLAKAHAHDRPVARGKSAK